jgi:hypothetical protein
MWWQFPGPLNAGDNRGYLGWSLLRLNSDGYRRSGIMPQKSPGQMRLESLQLRGGHAAAR